jgi:predicted DNA-binding protein (UPF0251 family)
MSRPRRKRFINYLPAITYFKPRGVFLADLEEVELGFDELEALRLCDFEKIDQVEAAKKMKISQSTLQRTLVAARAKIAEALIKGKAICLKGGDYQMVPRGFGRGAHGGGRGRMGGPKAAGPGGFCVCPSCGQKISHVAGSPCYQQNCPKCNTRMVRE